MIKPVLRLVLLGLTWVFAQAGAGGMPVVEQAALVKSAEAYMKSGEYPKALLQLQKARSLNSAELKVDQMMRQCLVHMGDWVPSGGTNSEWIDVDRLRLDDVLPKGYDSLFRVGKSMEERENYDIALRIYSHLTEKQPGNKDYGKAFQDLRLKIEQLAQNHVDVGEIYLKQGRFGRALEEYHAAQFFRPRDAFIVDRIKLATERQNELHKSYDERLQSLLQKGNRDQAMLVAEKAFRDFPEEENFRKALDTLQSLRSSNLQKVLAQCRAAIDSGNFEKAESQLQNAMLTFGGEPQIDALYQEAHKKLEQQRNKERSDSTRATFAQAVEQGNTSLAAGAMQALQRQGDTVGIQKLQVKLDELKGRQQALRDFEATVDRARRALKDGVFDEAKAALQKAMEMNAVSPVARQLLDDVHREEAKALEVEQAKRKDVQKAEALLKAGQLKEAKKVDLSLTGTHQVDQEVKQVQRNIREAEYARTPENDKKAQDLFLEGIGKYRAGDYQDAVDNWTQVLKLNPDHEQAKKYIANVKQKLARMQ